jgi:hypothetical protein
MKENCRGENISLSPIARFLAEECTIKEHLTREKHTHLIQALCDIETFTSEDPLLKNGILWFRGSYKSFFALHHFALWRLKPL